RAERDARHAVPVRLLLEAPGVGQDHARLCGERRQLEVADRRQRQDSRAELETFEVEGSARPGMNREQDGLLQAVDALDDAAEPRLARVGFAVEGEQEVPVRLEP